MKKTFLILCLVLLSGCMGLQKPKLYPFPSNEVAVRGSVIYCSGRPFAELKYFDIYNTGVPFSEATRPLGLVIHYYENDREVWIHPKKRLSVVREGIEYTKIEDMNRVWTDFHKSKDPSRAKWAYVHIGGKQWEKEDIIRSFVYDVKVSTDGKVISYKSQGIIFNSSHKYLVEYGD